MSSPSNFARKSIVEKEGKQRMGNGSFHADGPEADSTKSPVVHEKKSIVTIPHAVSHSPSPLRKVKSKAGTNTIHHHPNSAPTRNRKMDPFSMEAVDLCIRNEHGKRRKLQSISSHHDERASTKERQNTASGLDRISSSVKEKGQSTLQSSVHGKRNPGPMSGPSSRSRTPPPPPTGSPTSEHASIGVIPEKLPKQSGKNKPVSKRKTSKQATHQVQVPRSPSKLTQIYKDELTNSNSSDSSKPRTSSKSPGHSFRKSISGPYERRIDKRGLEDHRAESILSLNGSHSDHTPFVPKRDASKSPGQSSRSMSAKSHRTNGNSSKSRLSETRGESVLSVDATPSTPTKRSSESIKAKKAPMTWHDDRDSRKLKGSKIYAGLAMIPNLDGSGVDDTISRFGSSGPSKGYRRSSDQSRQASPQKPKSSSIRTDQSQESSKVPKSRASLVSKASHTGSRIVSKSDHHSVARLSRSAHNSTTTSRHSTKSNGISNASTRSTRNSGFVGSMIGAVDRVLSKAVYVPESKYGSSSNSKTVNFHHVNFDDDDDADSFANDDVEATGYTKASQKSERRSIGGGPPRSVGYRESSSTSRNSSLREEAATKLKGAQQPSMAFRLLEKTLGIEKKPSKTLLIIWCLIVAELAFDFVTTVISFRAFSRGQTCCGFEISLGNIPVGITAPFFCLVLAESLFLFIAITISLWPSILVRDVDIEKTWRNRLFCCVNWNASAVLNAINVTVIVNPFFGCVIAWILLYQSDKTESFLVLGLEGASIILHFLSVWLDGSCKTWKGLCFHCVQFVPFFTSITLILLYLRQGGVCYLVSEGEFLFSGCELCQDSSLPVDGTCQLDDGTIVQITNQRVWNIEGGFGDLADAFVARSVQAEYCATDHPEGPEDVNFCFFEY